mmetsp:Transcript_15961/g.22391  ORF Transcript_15961/g.22391 Transcript_15961/m.22391 type:complete len:102 (+) Transcript_15961:258-563(+)
MYRSQKDTDKCERQLIKDLRKAANHFGISNVDPSNPVIKRQCSVEVEVSAVQKAVLITPNSDTYLGKSEGASSTPSSRGLLRKIEQDTQVYPHSQVWWDNN